VHQLFESAVLSFSFGSGGYIVLATDVMSEAWVGEVQGAFAHRGIGSGTTGADAHASRDTNRAVVQGPVFQTSSPVQDIPKPWLTQSAATRREQALTA
jgi:hypothetical protein